MQLLIFCFLCPCLSLFADLVDLQSQPTSIPVDLRYATTNNKLETALYPAPKIYVDEFVARNLGRVQRDLAKEGLGLIVYEGYRPQSVQSVLDDYHQFNSCFSYQFDDSAHYRKGLGVDVGIYYLDGQPLNLPTEWGDDCAKAYRDYPFHDGCTYHNSAILAKYMAIYGFEPMRERWWHFDLRGWELAPNLNFEYADLAHTSPKK